MGAFAVFLVKSAFRNRRRAMLTASGVAVATFVVTVLVALLTTMSATVARGGSEILLWVVDRHQAQHLLNQIPASYVPRIQSVPGVDVVSPVVFSMARYRTDQDLIIIMGVDPATIRAARPFEMTDESSWRAFVADRRGALVGGDLATRYAIKVGDTVTLRGMGGRGRENLTFTASAIDRQFAPGRFTVHLDYLTQSLGLEGIVTNIWVKVDRPSSAPRVAAAIDALFSNHPVQTKTQSHKGFMGSMMQRLEGLELGVALLSAAVVITVMVSTANAIAMGARERTAEVGTLKSLGFRTLHVLALVLGESVLLAGLGGGLGLAVAYGLVTLAGLKFPLPIGPVRGQPLALGADAALTALAASLLVGLLGGFWPALRAARLRIVDALRESAG